MPDADKVVRGLERCLICDPSPIAPAENQKAYLDCEYTVGLYCNRNKLLRDAIALLKEQKESDSFIVIDTKTGKEADIYNIALYEDWAKHLCYCDMDGWAIQDDGSLLLLDECGRYAYADRERFKVKWNDYHIDG